MTKEYETIRGLIKICAYLMGFLEGIAKSNNCDMVTNYQIKNGILKIKDEIDEHYKTYLELGENIKNELKEREITRN